VTRGPTRQISMLIRFKIRIRCVRKVTAAFSAKVCVVPTLIFQFILSYYIGRRPTVVEDLSVLGDVDGTLRTAAPRVWNDVDVEVGPRQSDSLVKQNVQSRWTSR